MRLQYIVPRLIRHFLPEPVTRFLLLRSVIIKPGLETADPHAAAARYVEVLKSLHRSLEGMRVLVFGYGGRFDIGVGLLKLGAAQVLLCDKFAVPDDRHNRGLLGGHGAYLESVNGRPRPGSDRLRLIHEDVGDLAASELAPRMNLIVSTSVYEHVSDVEGSTRALAALTDENGLQIHFVDLRDHFFKYPFEMLTYSPRTWRRWLNPTSNHNRLRVRDYRKIFHKYFAQVEIEVLQRDETAFSEAQARILPEFKTGEAREDAVTLIRIIAREPRRQPPQ
jgi:hypothetical protein